MSSNNMFIVDNSICNDNLSKDLPNKLCRTCLNENENDLLFIFSISEKYNKTYAKLIMEMTPVIILEDENFSHNICTNCVTSLCNSYEFQQQCIKSDTIIRARQQKIAVKIENHRLDSNGTANLVSEELNYVSEIMNIDAKPHVCFICNVACNSSSELDEHVKETHGEVKVENVEKEYLKVISELERKKKNKLSKELVKQHCRTKPNHCDTCDRSYTSYRNLLEHVKRMHIPDKTSCNVCQKVFPSATDLKKHTHVCEDCGTYSENGDLSNHICLINKVEKEPIKSEVESQINKTNNQLVLERCKREDLKQLASEIDSDQQKRVKELERKKKIRFQRQLVRLHFKTKVNHCDTCNKTYSHVLQHIKRVHAPEKISCDICKKEFPNKLCLKTHKHLCELCGEYSEDGNLSHHNCSNAMLIEKLIKLHFKTKPNFCDTCNKSYETKRAVYQHIRAAHSGNKSTCDVCNKVFSNSFNLKRHKNLHLGIKEHMCDCCGKKFAQKGELFQHVRAVHAERMNGESRKKPEFKCFLCDKVLSNKKVFFSHHFQTHNGESIPCWICGTLVANRYLLYEHLTTHDGHKRHTCKFCPKKFLHRVSLRIHERSHTGERPFKCKLCDKAFIQKPHLRSHEFLHTGEKPFKCKFCPKSFRHQTTYLQHKRIHTGERPYRCKVCNKGFYHLTNMKKHNVLHFKL